jgi:hypothetical protein
MTPTRFVQQRFRERRYTVASTRCYDNVNDATFLGAKYALDALVDLES